MKVFTSPTVRRLRKLVVVDRHLEDILHENHDFHHRERIDTEVFDQAQIVVGVLHFIRKSGSTNRSITPITTAGKMFRIAGLTKLDGRFEGRR